MSNSTQGRGKKGSKFWIQTLLNIDDGKILTKEIQKVDSSICNVTWLSPLKQDNYRELKIKEILEKYSISNPQYTDADLSFWPDKGPWWDAVGIVSESDTIILVEAKAHIVETNTKCLAKDLRSITLIKKSMEAAHDYLNSHSKQSIVNNHIYNDDIWFNKYYQLGNRLTFMAHLRKLGLNVKLILLNIVNDPTHKSTNLDEWNVHYKNVFQLMLGSCKIPKDVLIINFDVG